MNWIKKAPRDGRSVIPTHSSAPKSHPNQLAQHIVDAIVGQRKKHSRCAKVVHRELKNQGIAVDCNGCPYNVSEKVAHAATT